MLHDAPIDIIDIYLIASPSPGAQSAVSLSSRSKLISSLEVKVQQYNIEMLQSFDIESIHGMQNASFTSMSEQPPQSIFDTFIFFAWPSSVFQCSSNDFICKTRTCENSIDYIVN